MSFLISENKNNATAVSARLIMQWERIFCLSVHDELLGTKPEIPLDLFSPYKISCLQIKDQNEQALCLAWQGLEKKGI